jgi:hypothetical protein
MEYVILRATRPTWLNTQLPAEAAHLMEFEPGSGASARRMSRTLVFFARGPGIVRVASQSQASQVAMWEMARNRHLGQASVSDKLLFNLPAEVQRHLPLHTEPRGPNGIRATDDGIIWFLPAPEYYEFRAYEKRERAWTGPSTGEFAHLYLAKSILPIDRQLGPLTDLETRIEAEEWRPRIEALQRVARARRASVGP